MKMIMMAYFSHQDESMSNNGAMGTITINELIIHQNKKGMYSLTIFAELNANDTLVNK